jgi:hypothetical protein
VLLQGLQGGLKERETIADIQPDLFRLEVKLRRTVDSWHDAIAMRANTAGSQTSDQQLSAKLRKLQTQVASQLGQQRSVPGTQRRERRCHRCGSADHMVQDCPHPFAGQGTLRSDPVSLSGPQWKIDSGWSHDMHPQGMLGARALAAIASLIDLWWCILRKREQPLTEWVWVKRCSVVAPGLWCFLRCCMFFRPSPSAANQLQVAL